MATSKKPVEAAQPEPAPAAKPKAPATAKKVAASKKPTSAKTAKPATTATTTAPKAAPAAKTPAKKTPAKKVAKAASRVVTPEQRANYIEVAAFYIAERRGFAPGNPEEDWLQAAAEIDRLIAEGHFGK